MRRRTCFAWLAQQKRWILFPEENQVHTTPNKSWVKRRKWRKKQKKLGTYPWGSQPPGRLESPSFKSDSTRAAKKSLICHYKPGQSLITNHGPISLSTDREGTIATWPDNTTTYHSFLLQRSKTGSVFCEGRYRGEERVIFCVIVIIISISLYYTRLCFLQCFVAFTISIDLDMVIWYGIDRRGSFILWILIFIDQFWFVYPMEYHLEGEVFSLRYEIIMDIGKNWIYIGRFCLVDVLQQIAFTETGSIFVCLATFNLYCLCSKWSCLFFHHWGFFSSIFSGNTWIGPES